MSMRIHDHFPAPLGGEIARITPFVGKREESHTYQRASGSIWRAKLEVGQLLAPQKEEVEFAASNLRKEMH